MSDLTLLIPAAGDARRMRGTDKLTQEAGGLPLLHRQASAALATGQQVVVTLPPSGHPHHAGRLAALAGLPVVIEEVPDAASGLAASLRRGLLPIGEETLGLMILLPDLPDLVETDLEALIASFLEQPDHILRATTQDGRPGHPVILPRRLFGQLARLKGDTGARAIVAAEAQAGRVRHLALAGDRALTDLDTPEAWAAWRARQ
ncbi:hypothetical protein U879_02400 [Defluviimonas sp. 20V17]|uniref:CTP:molybdopterin cytidylyltransferase MocA n=1 Tax=Allgaiera indica TaxID=765699 RepID=A0AAN4UUY4_9RHOB|nr:nucleotidyltransferase family protein [Allgaiera indica]KDB05284.1 hypothetical protein U879_02400 [Defluviimonas sp. 20V17]GHE04928.1 molybdopterin-guanine dinucleotide biosynthesis protein A [Allgaiera indica]SDX59760.1 CTP:molybdopterin cytidylyltransferase MocA [Allgaiera indica]